MEDIVLIKLVFLVGLLVLSGAASISAYVIARLGGQARVGRTGRRQVMKDIPVRGTR